MLFHEPPTHTRLRGPLNRRFTPKAVAHLGGDIDQITNHFLDRLSVRDEVDLAEMFGACSLLDDADCAEQFRALGHELRTGDTVFTCVLAANRDPRVFVEPDCVVLDRAPNPHRTFGLGHHFCWGASLARLEVRSALRRRSATGRRSRYPCGLVRNALLLRLIPTEVG